MDFRATTLYTVAEADGDSDLPDRRVPARRLTAANRTLVKLKAGSSDARYAAADRPITPFTQHL